MASNDTYRLAVVKDYEGDISREWHIEYYCLSPATGRLVRRKPSFQSNRIKDPDKRRQRLQQEMLLTNAALKEGWNYFVHGNDQREYWAAKGNTIQQYGPTVIYAIEQVLKHRATYQPADSLRTPRSIAKAFTEYLEGEGLKEMLVSQIRRKHVLAYLQTILDKGNTTRTYNNHRGQLHTFFENMLDQEIISDESAFTNPVARINVKPTKSEIHVAYTARQIAAMSVWLQEYEPYTLLFARFIAYSFLRPKELRLLKVCDIDLAAKNISIPAQVAKIDERQNRLIQDLLLPLLQEMGIASANPRHYVFSRWQQPGPEPIGINYFTQRFKPWKESQGLGQKHTLYGIKHTFVSHLIRSGEPIRNIMLMTGHKTIAAFEKYARSIVGDTPKDLSNRYTMRL